MFFGHLQSVEIIHCHEYCSKPTHFHTELRYKRQLCGESCGPGLVSKSPVNRKIFGAHIFLSGSSEWVIHIVNKENRKNITTSNVHNCTGVNGEALQLHAAV